MSSMDNLESAGDVVAMSNIDTLESAGDAVTMSNCHNLEGDVGNGSLVITVSSLNNPESTSAKYSLSAGNLDSTGTNDDLSNDKVHASIS